MDFRTRITTVLHHQNLDRVPFAPYDNLVPRGDFDREMRNRGKGNMISCFMGGQAGIGKDVIIYINFPGTVFWSRVEATKQYTLDLIKSNPPGDRLIIAACYDLNGDCLRIVRT